MTSTIDTPVSSETASRPPASAPRQPGRRPSTGRVGIVVVLIVALLASALVRDWARSERARGAIEYADTGGQSLANMNSFALALLLGGLRGPLVMVLWTQSEQLKNEKNLEDFDTYVEWIRLLQPEFDTVHIFQVWNKAYNVSVQMASWANKYTTILDAIEYANRVLAQRPDDISMIYQKASIFFDKLGSASEKDYYKERVRRESLPHESKQKLRPNEPGWRRLDFDPVLDASGHILPKLLEPTKTRPANIPPGSEWNDGSELQYLKPYNDNGFPYGLSAFGFAYNYHKIAQVMQTVDQVRHANLSDLVVDSRPALALKGWSEDEWEHGRRLELKASNIAVPTERRDMEMPTANIAPDVPITDEAAIRDAIFSYDLGARLSRDAIPEYERHLRSYTMNLTTYQSHMEGLRAQEPLMEGDRDYLKAILAKNDPGARSALLKSAAQHYKDSVSLNLAVILHYYLPDQLAPHVLPAGITRADIAKLTPEQRLEAYQRLLDALKSYQFDPDAEDRSDYQRYVDRAQTRIARIEQAAK